MLTKLTRRETEYLKLISLGYRGKQLALKMKISRNTTPSYAANVSRKLETNTQAQSVAVAIRLGLIN